MMSLQKNLDTEEFFEPKIVKSYARIDEARKEKEMIYLYR